MIKYILLLLIFSTCYSQKRPVAHGQKVERALIPKAVKESIIRRVENGTNTRIVIGVIDSIDSRFYSYGVKSLNSLDSVDRIQYLKLGQLQKHLQELCLLI